MCPRNSNETSFSDVRPGQGGDRRVAVCVLGVQHGENHCFQSVTGCRCCGPLVPGWGRLVLDCARNAIVYPKGDTGTFCFIRRVVLDFDLHVSSSEPDLVAADPSFRFRSR